MPTDLERLTVLIEANTTQYTRAMLRLQGQTDKAIRAASKSVKSLDSSFTAMAKSAKSLGALLGVSLGVGAVKGLASFAADTVHSAAALVDLADKVGISTDALQELRYQFEQNGSSAEAFDAAISKFSKNIGLAAAGSGELKKILDANGIALRDAHGALRPLTDLLADYADLIKNATDDQQRAVLAVQAFGKAGDEAALALRGGSAEMRGMAEDAHHLNQVIGEEGLRQLEAYDDQIAILEGSWHRFTTEAVIGVLSIIKAGQQFREANERLFNPPQRNGLQEQLEDINREIEALQSLSAAGLIDAGGFNADMARLAALHRELIALRKDADSGALTKFFPNTADRTKDDTLAPPGPATIVPPPAAGGGGHARAAGRNAAADAAKREHDQVVDLIAELQRELSLVGATDEQRRISNELHQAGAEATDKEKQQIIGLVSAIEAQEKAQDTLIDTLDTIRDAAGGALDAFAQSIANSEGPLKAMKAALQDILQTVLRLAEEKLLLQLFGAAGTSTLGGLKIPGLSLGGAGASAQAVAVHVTASPLFEVKIAQSASAAEGRAIARGPSVARNNQQRYAVP